MKFHFVFVAVLIILFILPSCSFFKNKIEEKPIAKVNDKFLYPTDVAGMIPKGTTEEDSIQIIQNYIQTWIQKNLLIEKAELNLTHDQKNVDEQLEEYRSSLIIFEYEKEYIHQHLDTIVSMDEIEQYYNQHKQDFVLKDNIYDIAYVKFKKTATKLDQAKKWLISGEKEDIVSLEDFAYNNALDFLLTKENWMSFEAINKIIPLRNEDELKYNHIVETTDSIAHYMLKVTDFKLKNSVPPLNFEIENIRNITINKRKLKLIKGLESSLYKIAQANGELEIY